MESKEYLIDGKRYRRAAEGHWVVWSKPRGKMAPDRPLMWAKVPNNSYRLFGRLEDAEKEGSK